MACCTISVVHICPINWMANFNSPGGKCWYRSPSYNAGDYIHMHPSDWRSDTLQTFLASGSEPTINVSGEAGQKIDYWLATARQEKIVSLKIIHGYNPPRKAREKCMWGFFPCDRERASILC